MSWFTFNLQDFSISFLSILFEGVPFMFIGTLLSGIIDAFVPSETMEKFLPRNQIAAIALSGVLGVVFPMCECGVVPVIRRLIRKGLPVSCALTYLLAAPIVNPIVALSTFAAFRGQHPAMVTSMRLLWDLALPGLRNDRATHSCSRAAKPADARFVAKTTSPFSCARSACPRAGSCRSLKRKEPRVSDYSRRRDRSSAR